MERRQWSVGLPPFSLLAQCASDPVQPRTGQNGLSSTDLPALSEEGHRYSLCWEKEPLRGGQGQDWQLTRIAEPTALRWEGTRERGGDWTPSLATAKDPSPGWGPQGSTRTKETHPPVLKDKPSAQLEQAKKR